MDFAGMLARSRLLITAIVGMFTTLACASAPSAASDNYAPAPDAAQTPTVIHSSPGDARSISEPPSAPGKIDSGTNRPPTIVRHVVIPVTSADAGTPKIVSPANEAAGAQIAGPDSGVARPCFG